MINAQFKNLCREASLVLQAEDVDAFSLTGEIQIDGVDIAARFEEDLAPDRIVCLLDIGPVGEEMAVIQTLLELNLSRGSKTEGVYAFDSTSGNALLVVHLTDPDDFDGKSLADALRLRAAQVLAARAMLG